MNASPVRLGISRCLLGDAVRYDGGHKRDGFLADVLGRFVTWVPVCPEVEAGLGTPREAMRLVGNPNHPELVTITTGRNMTEPLSRGTERRLDALEDEDLSGYIFKKDSPSCGIERVRVFNQNGIPSRAGVGLFARAFMDRFPLVPIEDEGRLSDPAFRENFIERVFCYRRYQDLLQSRVTRDSVVRFHTIHKYLLLAHSPQQYHMLGHLVGQAHRYRPRELAIRYGELFMKTLAVKTTPRKHTNVLQHIMGYFKGCLDGQEKVELLGVIDDHHRRLTPLIVPITLIKHYLRKFKVAYVGEQVYLNPHPKELMLRNHM